MLSLAADVIDVITILRCHRDLNLSPLCLRLPLLGEIFADHTQPPDDSVSELP